MLLFPNYFMTTSLRQVYKTVPLKIKRKVFPINTSYAKHCSFLLIIRTGKVSFKLYFSRVPMSNEKWRWLRNIPLIKIHNFDPIKLIFRQFYLHMCCSFWLSFKMIFLLMVYFGPLGNAKLYQAARDHIMVFVSC